MTHHSCDYVHSQWCSHCRSPPVHNCMVYDGSECTTIFGHANINSHDIRATDAAIHAYFNGDQMANFTLYNHSTSCQNFIRFIMCINAFNPCPGTFWCGSYSKDVLLTKAGNACSCADAESCTVGGVDVSSGIILLNPHYYERSFIPRVYGYNINDVCQDVTPGE